MKKLIINNCMKLIIKDTHYDDIKLQEIRYGLEALYLNISKFIVFFIVNALLGNFWIGLLFFLFYIPIKSASYGFHAKTSLQCWIISAIAFVGLPYIANYLYFDLYSKIILIVIFMIAFWLLSPADTPKRPLVNPQKRKALKIASIFILFIYSGLIIISNNLSNIIILTLFYQLFLISPLTYKMFNTQYNNYLYYKLS